MLEKNINVIVTLNCEYQQKVKTKTCVYNNWLEDDLNIQIGLKYKFSYKKMFLGTPQNEKQARNA